MISARERRRKIGRLGEALFQNLCIKCGLVATRPDQDENGWDFLVEFPQNRLSNKHMDSQPVPIKFLCQVKSTDNFKNRSISIKISNFEHLARAILPTFLFIVNFSKSDEPLEVYLSHFGEFWIHQTLKRIRELQQKGQTNLSNHKMKFKADLSQNLSNINRINIADLITFYTGNDLAAYSAKKIEWLNSVGFDRSRHKMDLIFCTSLPDMIDGLLGLRDIEIIEGKISSTRFGIDLLDGSFQKGKLSISSPPVNRCKLIVLSKSKKETYTIEGDLYVPQIPGIGPEDLRMRIKVGYIDILLAPLQANFSIGLDSDLEYDLHEFIDCAKVLGICLYPDAEMQCLVEHRQIAILHPKFDEAVVKQLRPVVYTSTFVGNFLRRLPPVPSAKVKIAHFFPGEETLKLLNLVIRSKKQRITTETDADPSLDGRTEEGIFCTPIAFKVVGAYIVAFCYWNAFFSFQNSMLTCDIEDCRVWDVQIFTDKNLDNIALVHKHFEKFCRSMGNGTTMFRSLSGWEEASRIIDQ